MTFLYKSEVARGNHWKSIFATREPNLPFRMWPDVGDPALVRYIAAWLPPDDIATAYPNLEVLFSVGAGVDQLDLDAVPSHVKVVRMLDPSVPEIMAEYVVTAVLSLHCDVLTHAAQQQSGIWNPLPSRSAGSRRVGVLGLGQLGRLACNKLATAGFRVAGWSRSRHEIDSIETFVGADEFDAFLGRTDILVCLLPLTPATQGILGGSVFSRLPHGAMIVNVGRGGHLDQAALLAALDSGQISGAVLDVTDPEPLPSNHPMWQHPRILLTPHIASAAQPETSVEVILDNLQLLRAGKDPIGLIDRQRGY
ncbi:2-hydroxyacid dehydrogenase [Bosea sp. PAMC 26642]|uniref:2-hydroxyacid dehydrogenase n=1 Tax=Bosea sp. (strain PAMC 26642) TaxID=1792307 RepID=UPI0007706142|nr:glyoxylate/hydroxypyruvate reductase A [Bosea sp. PAMC 26642]AMJ61392.1 glyoxylate/hydroxypyruvate reductase A [Bosea sp. PAMC 26642]